MKKGKQILFSFIVTAIAVVSCKKDPPLNSNDSNTPVLSNKPTPYTLQIPNGFPTNYLIPEDNPMTIEGVALGKKLFFDPILSGNNTQSCGSCHAPAAAFSDNINNPFSKGIDGIMGSRNTPTIINALWGNSFFWDGKAPSLEAQALFPVQNPIEMHLSWQDAVAKLQASSEYVTLFEKAFNSSIISKELVVKAIAQFERTLISSNAPIDNELASLDSTTPEGRGYALFVTEKGDCFHCHGLPEANPLLTDNLFHNNGLDAFPSDSGYAKVSKKGYDVGKFKTPTLRNLVFSAPYMHDGRFNTLEDVIDFYSSGLKYSATIDPLMKKVSSGGINLSPQEKQDLIAFLKMMTDSSFVTNPSFLP